VKVQLRDIPCHRSVELGPRFVADALASLPMRAALERPGDDPDAGSAHAEVDLYVEGENVFARGRLRGAFTVACSRCVGPAEIDLDEDLAVTFLPRAQLPEEVDEDAADGPEGEEPAEFAEDDVDVFPYEGEAVDLEPLLRERLILAVPFAPLCREGCKGLCPTCGTDRNQASCGCDARPVDPRLAALKDLKV
jgi:uncharacterized protein